MKTVSISGSPRENVGKKDAKMQRNQGLVPCVLYGGKDQITFTVEEGMFKNIIYTPDVVTIKIKIGNNDYDAILKEVQFHPVTDKILHVDFLQIFPDKYVTMSVPIKLIGNPVGVLAGGKIFQKFRKLKLRALPAHLPDTIDLNIQSLEIGQSIKVSDVVRDNITFLDPKNSVIIYVRISRAVVEEEKPVEAVTTEAAATPGATPATATTTTAAKTPPAKTKK